MKRMLFRCLLERMKQDVCDSIGEKIAHDKENMTYFQWVYVL